VKSEISTLKLGEVFLEEIYMQIYYPLEEERTI